MLSCFIGSMSYVTGIAALYRLREIIHSKFFLHLTPPRLSNTLQKFFKYFLNIIIQIFVKQHASFQCHYCLIKKKSPQATMINFPYFSLNLVVAAIFQNQMRCYASHVRAEIQLIDFEVTKEATKRDDSISKTTSPPKRNRQQLQKNGSLHPSENPAYTNSCGNVMQNYI